MWTPFGVLGMNTFSIFCNSARIDESENLTLDHIQHSLVRQEDSLIFYLLERAQYCYNVDTYEPDAFSMDDHASEDGRDECLQMGKV
ncbi:hypothetical protein K1719_016108 [Acacia pycnantha]|nr:hypothetical protein K1719_016108 [Acacia pycnantha]